MEDLQRIYFSFIHDASKRSFEEADRILSGTDDNNVLELYEAGKEIGKVVRSDADPAILDRALERMKGLPPLDCWKELIEISGQVVIGKALTVEDQPRRKALLGQGLNILSIAASGAFPLSGFSSQMVAEAKKAEPSLADEADAILIRNSGLEPWSPRGRRRAEAPKEDARKARS